MARFDTRSADRRRRRARGCAAAVALALVAGALGVGPALAQDGASGTLSPPQPDSPAAPSAQDGTRQPSHSGPRLESQHRDPPPPDDVPRNPFGSPQRSPRPALPVPSLVVAHWRIPMFLLPVYQAAGLRYGVPWQVLAAINEVESDYGRNPTESSAGAVGWMQFMPATWSRWGIDASSDGARDPADPVDAIFSAARYLHAAGAATDLRRALFAYNHAGWYVDAVLLRARLVEMYPQELVGSLTGLASARFPVAARARYSADSRSATIYTRRGAPVVAAADAVVSNIGRSPRRGRYVDLEDAYGNRYGYSHLGGLARFYAVPRRVSRPVSGGGSAIVPPASGAAIPPAPSAAPASFFKPRLFAHPSRPRSQAAGGFEQLLMSQGYDVFDGGVAGPLRLDPRFSVLKPLGRGSHVLASTLLGRVRGRGRPTMRFTVHPPGGGSEPLAPRPVIETWAALARERFEPDRAAAALVLPQAGLERRVLADPRVAIDRCLRRDVRARRVDRRVLATLEYLAESGLDPTATAPRCGHALHAASADEPAALDISAVDRVPVLGNQGPGGVADRTVRRLMLLQGDARPHEIVSLLSFGSNTLALADHAGDVHVGFSRLATDERRPARLDPHAWALLGRGLSAMPQPVLPPRPSRWALRG